MKPNHVQQISYGRPVTGKKTRELTDDQRTACKRRKRMNDLQTNQEMKKQVLEVWD